MQISELKAAFQPAQEIVEKMNELAAKVEQLKGDPKSPGMIELATRARRLRQSSKELSSAMANFITSASVAAGEVLALERLIARAKIYSKT